MTSKLRITAVFLPLLVLEACGGGGQSATCIPGASVACACPNGQQGAQVCTLAGTFGACVCATPGLDGGGVNGAGGSGGAFASLPDVAASSGSGGSAGPSDGGGQDSADAGVDQGVAASRPDADVDGGVDKNVLGTSPAIVSFTASPTTISTGQISTLSWMVTGATMLSLDQGAGSALVSVLGTTTQVVTPTKTTTYTLTLNASVTAQVTVAVAPLPSIASFVAGPTVVNCGNSAILTAVFSDGTGSVDHGIGAVTSGIGASTGPITEESTTYTLTVTSALGGTTTAQVTVLRLLCAKGNTVSFARGVALGAMTGWAWVRRGLLDSISDPTISNPSDPSVSDRNCADPTTTYALPCEMATQWSSPDALCISGAISALPAVPVQADYDNDWGIEVGVNATYDQPSGTLGATAAGFSDITFTLAGSPLTGLRAQLHRLGDPETTTYCANLVSGTPVPFVGFNTKCQDGSGTALTALDVPNIDKIGVQVMSGSAKIMVTNLCLTGITFD